MESTFKNPVAADIVVGSLKLIPEDDRPASWVLSSGSATSFTDVDFSSYVPYGTKALLIQYILRLNGDGVEDTAYARLRKNGSSNSDDEQLVRIDFAYTNLASGIVAGHGGQVIALCDADGKIEYIVSTSNADLWLSLDGYFL